MIIVCHYKSLLKVISKDSIKASDRLWMHESMKHNERKINMCI